MGSSCGSGAGRWCCPGAVIALGVGGACLWSVPGAVSGLGSAGCCQLITKLGASSQLRLSCATSAGLRSSDACWKWCGVLGPRRDVERYGYQGFAQRQVRTSGVGAKRIGAGRMIGAIFELAGEIGAA